MGLEDHGGMPRFIRVLLTGIGFLGFGLFGALIAYLVLPLTDLGTSDRNRRQARAQAVLHRCCRIYLGALRWMGLFRFDAQPNVASALRQHMPAVIVANHPTLLDIIVVLAQAPRATFLAKTSWFENPLVSPILRRTGAISGPRPGRDGSPMDGALVLDNMLDRLRRGASVVIFPEGTRSPADGLHRFQEGAFEIALRAHAPVVALLLRVEPPTLMKGQPWHRVPPRRVRFDVGVMAVIEPTQAPGSRRAFRTSVQAAYARALDLAPPVGSSAADVAPVAPEAEAAEAAAV